MYNLKFIVLVVIILILFYFMDLNQNHIMEYLFTIKNKNCFQMIKNRFNKCSNIVILELQLDLVMIKYFQ